MPLDYYERICVPSLMQPRPLRLHVVHASHYKGLRAFQKISFAYPLHLSYPSFLRARNDNTAPMSNGSTGKRRRTYALSERGYPRVSYNTFNKLGHTRTKVATEAATPAPLITIVQAPALCSTC